MPSITLGASQGHARQGASITFTQIFETYPGSNQPGTASGVTIGITATNTAGSGTGTPVATTGTGITSTSASQYQYVWPVPMTQVPGSYLVTWTGTVGSQTVTYVQTVTVTAMPSGSPEPGVYATVAQYQAWSGDAVTPGATVATALRRASEDIDNAAIGAVYAVNANGMPTDPVVADVFSRATCAQAQFVLADNDVTGIKRQYVSMNVGGVSATRAPVTAAHMLPPLGPRALQILHVNGVLPSAALINW